MNHYYLLEQALLEKTLNYLATKPYKEVYLLIQELNNLKILKTEKKECEEIE